MFRLLIAVTFCLSLSLSTTASFADIFPEEATAEDIYALYDSLPETVTVYRQQWGHGELTRWTTYKSAIITMNCDKRMRERFLEPQRYETCRRKMKDYVLMVVANPEQFPQKDVTTITDWLISTEENINSRKIEERKRKVVLEQRLRKLQEQKAQRLEQEALIREEELNRKKELDKKSLASLEKAIKKAERIAAEEQLHNKTVNTQKQNIRNRYAQIERQKEKDKSTLQVESASRTASKVQHTESSRQIDQMTTYAVLLGRAAGCGMKPEYEYRRVGKWLDETFPPGSEDQKTYIPIFLAGLEYHAKQQASGKSPDTCSQVRRALSGTDWP